MIFRQKLELLLILILTFFAFASYHEGTGGTAWLMWLAVISILAFTYVFDVSFADESMFIFDPDADNWRRKVVCILLLLLLLFVTCHDMTREMWHNDVFLLR